MEASVSSNSFAGQPGSIPPASFLCATAAEAARRLDAGGLVLYPTETFFGIGCRADCESAVLRVFAAKQRKADMPLPVIIGNAEQAACVVAPEVLARHEPWAEDQPCGSANSAPCPSTAPTADPAPTSCGEPACAPCPDAAPSPNAAHAPAPESTLNADEAPSAPTSLADDIAALSAFWPGPLTLLLPARPGLPEALTGGTGRIALRVSPHPAARALALACGFPIVSSSANISGRPPVTQAVELDPELLAALSPGTDGIFDLPPAPGGGQASTIAEPLGGRRLILRREGALSAASLAEAGFTILRP